MPVKTDLKQAEGDDDFNFCETYYNLPVWAIIDLNHLLKSFCKCHEEELKVTGIRESSLFGNSAYVLDGVGKDGARIQALITKEQWFGKW